MRTLVIVLNYHGKAVLLPCLRSVVKTLGPEDRLLVVDNGQERALMEGVRAEFPQVMIEVPEENGGFARGMNVGLRLALAEGFEAVWILNNDVIVKEDSLSQLKEAAERTTGPRALSPLIRGANQAIWFAGGWINWWQMRVEHYQAEPKILSPFQTNFLTGCALFIPRITLERIGLLDERYFLYYEDVDYSLRILEQGGKLWVVPGAEILHHEVSEYRGEKVYWLVKSGVECFSRHSTGWRRVWLGLYLGLRRLRNWSRFLWGDTVLARLIEKAYTEASP